MLVLSLTRRTGVAVPGCSLCACLNLWGICCDKVSAAWPAGKEEVTDFRALS